VTGLDSAILGLEQALDRPRRQPMWHWLVRHRLAKVSDLLSEEPPQGVDAWLAPREETLLRERDCLVDRMTALSVRIAEGADPEPLRLDLKRLIADIVRHCRRRNDLVYDGVSLELGGSE
jgi:hypothetical protein